MNRTAARVATLLVFFLGVPAFAGPIITEDDGTRYEFLGLKHRSVQELQDTLAVLAPGVPLGRCAAYLTQVLGYPEASVILHQDSIGNYWVATVMEPEDKDRLVYNELPDHVADTIQAWAPVIEMAIADDMNFQATILARVPQLRAQADGTSGVPVPDWADTSEVKELLAAMDDFMEPEHLDLAVKTIESDANRANRLGALAILSNFPEQDLAWYTVMKVMTVRDPIISGMASSLMRAFAEQYPRPIDWSPVVSEIRAILAGTNLFHLHSTLNALQASSLQTSLAKRIHADRFQILGLWLEAEHEPTRSFVVDYLRAVSGEDFGYDVGQWEKWASE